MNDAEIMVTVAEGDIDEAVELIERTLADAGILATVVS